ncbi:MFS transporter [Streptomyces europaeiscabiei]|uniref:MFS transporter n=1 Tax=Streptomyces europaeiscabiei TaxID=146819 RepID=UPI0029BE783A|nr:MFS transporter [Streptomyces europaeiscabiei]MDX3613597.1 MFS transporter [Streptomyces europaeiscabiei]
MTFSPRGAARTGFGGRPLCRSVARRTAHAARPASWNSVTRLFRVAKAATTGRSRAGAHGFALVQIAALCGSVATRCVEIALAWWALAETGNDALVGVLLALAVGADVLSRGALAWVGDRFEPHRVVFWCFVGSALVSGLLTWLALTGAYELWIVALGIVLLGVGLGIREPLLMSMIRGLVETSSVSGAVRIRSAVMAFSSIAGPIAAGALIGPFGYAAVLGVACGVVAASAVLIVLLPASDGESPPRAQASGGFTGWATGTRDGFRAIRNVTPEWRLAMLTMVVNFALYPVFAVIVPVLVAQRYPDRTWVLSLVESAFGAGLIVGSAVLVKLGDGLFGRRRSVLAGFALLGAGFMGAGLVAKVVGFGDALGFTVLSSLLLMLSGIGLCMVTTNTGTVRLLATPSSHRNRMVASASFLSGIVMPLGSLFSGLISRTSGESWALIALGAAICVCSLVAARDTALAAFLDLPDEELDDIYLRKFPHAFGRTTQEVETTRP